MPGLVTVALYAFINSWNEFLGALIFMTEESNFTLPVMLVTVRSGLFGQVNWGALQAGVTIAIVPCVIPILVAPALLRGGTHGGALSKAKKGDLHGLPY